MALNLQTFKTRTLTALIFVVLMMAGLLINHWTFFILFTIIHFGCWIEYQRLIGLVDINYQGITPFHKYGVAIAGWCIMMYFTGDEYNIFGLPLHEAGWWLGLIAVFLLPLMELLLNPEIRLKNIGYSALGLGYISLSLGLMIDLSKQVNFFLSDTTYDFKFGMIPLFIIGCIWVNDTLAYLIGSWIGKRKLSKISPKKTWEGTLGGMILAIVAAGLLAWKQDLPLMSLMSAAGIITIAGTFGDLLQSKLKRMAGVKDSGSIMPGHGGFLDRFDSMIVAIPFVWLFVFFVVKSTH